MIPVSFGALLVVLMFPILVVGAVVFPPYAVWRFYRLRRLGLTDSFTKVRTRVWRFTLIGGGVLYAGLTLAMIAPQMAPTLSGFVEDGHLAFVVPIIFLDVLLATILSPDRALADRQKIHRDAS